MKNELMPCNKDTLTIKRSASIFRNTLSSVLAEKSPFADAPFVAQIAEKYLEDKNQSNYFTTNEGFGASITVCNGIAQPNIDLNLQEGLKSRHLKKRTAIRIGKENPTTEEIFHFAVGHELGHLIQGLADYVYMEDQDVSGMTKTQVDEFRRQIDEYNKNTKINKDIKNAQEYFLSIFKNDITRDLNEAGIDINHYTDETYLGYVNSKAESNADFISLWIMGMENPDMKTSPQNEAYHIDDWQRWAEDHRIDITQIA